MHYAPDRRPHSPSEPVRITQSISVLTTHRAGSTVAAVAVSVVRSLSSFAASCWSSSAVQSGGTVMVIRISAAHFRPV